LAPTVGIAATGFCYLGGILQLFHRRYQQIFSISSRSANFTTADNRSSQIDSTEFIINISYHLHRQDLQCFAVKNHQFRPSRRKQDKSRKSIYKIFINNLDCAINCFGSSSASSRGDKNLAAKAKAIRQGKHKKKKRSTIGNFHVKTK
jgi:hypothetical protein